MSELEDHLHPHRRGAAAGDVLLPADHRRRTPPRPASTSRPATSRSPAGSSRSFRRPAPRGPAGARRARRARRAGQDARGQHHQAAEHQRLDPAAEGRDRRAAGAGLRPARTTPTTRRRDDDKDVRARYDKVKGTAVNPVLREGNSDRRAPRVGEELRAPAPALDGRVVLRLQDQRRAHGGRRLPLQREVGGRSTTADTLRIELVVDDGTDTVLKESVPVQAGEVVDATVMSVAALQAFLRDADRAGQGRGRAVLGPPQGHHDEGLRPDHLRPRGARPSSRRSSRRTARRWPRPAYRPEQRTRRHPRRSGRAAGGARSRPPSKGLADGRARDGRLRQGHHQPARARAT